MRTHATAFLISALIHLGLLALVLTGVAQLPSDDLQETRLALSLQMFQPPPPPEQVETPEAPPEPVIEPEPVEVEPPPPEPTPVEPPPEPKPVPKPKPKPVPKPKPPPQPVERIQPVTPPPPPVARVAVASPPPAAVDSGLVRRIEDEYKTALREAIEANKGYPRRAVRLRQEGEAVVGFTIGRDGAISELRIVDGTGSALLDRAALEAVRKVDGTLPFPDEIERSAWDFTLPITYGLR